MTERRIAESWEANSEGWTAAVRGKRIASRETVTNQAVLNAVGPGPGKLLDLGCGEGWLSRALRDLDWDVCGVDGSSGLIEKARRLDPDGSYLVLSYEDLTQGLSGQQFDAVVANFSLLGDRSVDCAMRAAARLLQDGGRFIVQTVHPSGVENPDNEGWREESWTGLQLPGLVPSAWYYRTHTSWMKLLKESGFSQISLLEPQAPEAPIPSSLIYIATN